MQKFLNSVLLVVGFTSISLSLHAYHHYIKNNTDESIQVTLEQIGASILPLPVIQPIMSPHSESNINVGGACIRAINIREPKRNGQIIDRLEIPWLKNRCKGHSYTIDYKMSDTTEKPQREKIYIRLDQ